MSPNNYSIMPLSSIVTVVLRFFSLLWLVQGISMFAGTIATLSPTPFDRTDYLYYVAPVVMILLAMGTFFFSGAIARLVTPRPIQK